MFVGNLAFCVDQGMLTEAFEKFGPVRNTKVVVDNDTGRSRGFGFVSFDDVGAATVAVQEMNGMLFEGRTIRVQHAQGRPWDSS